MVIHTPEWKSIPFQPGSAAFLYEVAFLPTDASDHSQQAAVMSNSSCLTLPPLSSWISHRVKSINTTTQPRRITTMLSEEEENHNHSNRGDKEDVEEEELLRPGRRQLYSCTRAGILFPTDLKKDSFETVICGQRYEGMTEKHGCTTTNKHSVLLRLTNRTKILYSENENDVDDGTVVLSFQKLKELIQFNQTLLNWKTYGIEYQEIMKQKTESSPTTSAPKEKQPASHVATSYVNPEDSTFLFCPLLHPRHSDGTNCTGDSDLLIDWHLITEENAHEGDCLLDMGAPEIFQNHHYAFYRHNQQ
jgi:hypothetical protein